MREEKQMRSVCQIIKYIWGLLPPWGRVRGQLQSDDDISIRTWLESSSGQEEADASIPHVVVGVRGGVVVEVRHNCFPSSLEIVREDSNSSNRVTYFYRIIIVFVEHCSPPTETVYT